MSDTTGREGFKVDRKTPVPVSSQGFIKDAMADFLFSKRRERSVRERTAGRF